MLATARFAHGRNGGIEAAVPVAGMARSYKKNGATKSPRLGRFRDPDAGGRLANQRRAVTWT